MRKLLGNTDLWSFNLWCKLSQVKVSVQKFKLGKCCSNLNSKTPDNLLAWTPIERSSKGYQILIISDFIGIK